MKYRSLLKMMALVSCLWMSLVPEAFGAGNLLLEKRWRFVTAEGGQGTFFIEKDGSRHFKADCALGYLSLASISSVDLRPGHFYVASMLFERKTEACIPYLMVSMNGKRTPWPFVMPSEAPQAEEKIELPFMAQPDETKLSTHIIVKGTGEALVKDVRVREVSEKAYIAMTVGEPITALDFAGQALRKSWKSFGSLNAQQSDGISFQSSANGGILCDRLDWDAAGIKRLNVRCTGEAYAYLRLDFTTDKKSSSYLCLQAMPGKALREYSFRVSQNPVWRGKITSVKLTWFSYESPGVVTFDRIQADANDNLLPFAEEKGSQKQIYIDGLRPRAHYRLSWVGKNAPDMILNIFNRRHKELNWLALTPRQKSLEFQVPELVFDASLELKQNSSEGYPCLEELDWPKPDRSFPNWRGKWIWCSPESGPDNTVVWFEKKFHLDRLPQEASAVFTVDDSFEAYVNGQTTLASNDWMNCSAGSILPHLRVGTNSVVIRAYNNAAWGGLLGEIYIRDKDAVTYYPTDKSWKFHIGGKYIPGEFESVALELGAPPVSPWGQRMNYQYVGPKTKITMLQAGQGEAVFRIDRPVEDDVAKLPLTLHYADGRIQKCIAGIMPSTGSWKPGEEIRCKITIPPNSQQNVIAKLNCPFLDCQETFCQVPVQPAKAPELVTARIAGAGTRPYFLIDGQRYAPIYFDGFHKPENDWMLEKAKQGGCSIVRFTLTLDDFWPEEGRFDYTKLEDMMNAYLIHAPEMKAIFLLKLAMPKWWCAKYPDDCVAYDSGQPASPAQDRQALGSRRWLKDGSYALRQIIRHIRKSWYADRIFAMGPGESWNCEWFWSAVDANRKPAVSGYSAADYATFREYLIEKYKDDLSLRVAWLENKTTFKNFKMPTVEEQNQASNGNLLNPYRDAKLIDWFHFRNRAFGDAIETFARTIKEETDGKWLVGVYYGYYVMFSHINRKLQSCGHLDIERLARSPYVDIFWGPSIYHWRRRGQGDGIMQAAGSFTSHGKLVIVEQDMRTFSETASYEAGHGRSDTVAQTCSDMDRAFGLCLTQGVGTHWYDMYEIWFREPVLLEKMRNMIESYKTLPPAPAGNTPIEVCIVSDQESAFYTKHNDSANVHKSAVYELLRDWGRTSIPYRHVFVNDLIDDTAEVPEHKLYIVTDAVMMDERRSQKLQERFEREQASVLYLYAYGVTSPQDTPSAYNMEKLLGLSFRMENALLRPSLHGQFGNVDVHAVNFSASTPWFYPSSGFEQVLAKDDEGMPVLVYWRRAHVKNYFSTLMNPPTEVLRYLAQQADVHLYSGTSKHVCLVGNDAVFLIPHSDGETAISTPNGKSLRCIAGSLEGQSFASGQNFPIQAGMALGFIVE